MEENYEPAQHAPVERLGWRWLFCIWSFAGWWGKKESDNPTVLCLLDRLFNLIKLLQWNGLKQHEALVISGAVNTSHWASSPKQIAAGTWKGTRFSSTEPAKFSRRTISGVFIQQLKPSFIAHHRTLQPALPRTEREAFVKEECGCCLKSWHVWNKDVAWSAK